MRRVARIAAALILGALVWPAAAPEPARAQPAAMDPGAQAQWEERLERAHSRLQGARARNAAAEHAYQDMKQRHRPRGTERDAIVSEVEAARIELGEAEKAWPEVLAEARRAGVPQDTLRRFQQ